MANQIPEENAFDNFPYPPFLAGSPKYAHGSWLELIQCTLIPGGAVMVPNGSLHFITKHIILPDSVLALLKRAAEVLAHMR